MGENSSISWTHHTWNPWWGCARVSPGCEHCYAETFAKRTGHNVWGRTAPRRFLADPFRALLKMQRGAEKAGERHRVFIASMADIFEAHPEPEVRARQDAIRAELWALVPSLASLDLLLLTKRPQNVREMVPAAWMRDGFPCNVWLGTTCEDQQRADERIPHLLDCPAAVRWVSYEPALGPVDFSPWLGYNPSFGGREVDEHRSRLRNCSADGVEDRPRRPTLGWVIVGGESGGGARPFDVQWARDAVRQCREAGVPAFVKQLGARPHKVTGATGRFRTDPETGKRQVELTIERLWLRDPKGGDIDEFPEDLRVRQYPGGAR